MKHIQSLDKITDNPFFNMYHINFTDKEGKPGNYYFSSRNDEENLKIRTREITPEGLVVYAVTKERTPRIALVREYRFPIDDTIYSLPAGLIEKGETPEEAAVREMKEETGMTFSEYKGGNAFFRNSFLLAPGITDEAGCAVFGYLTDIKGNSQQESSEWIEPYLADKEEAHRILEKEKVSVRCAFLLFQFLQAPDENPFYFLSV